MLLSQPWSCCRRHRAMQYISRSFPRHSSLLLSDTIWRMGSVLPTNVVAAATLLLLSPSRDAIWNQRDMISSRDTKCDCCCHRRNMAWEVVVAIAQCDISRAYFLLAVRRCFRATRYEGRGSCCQHMLFLQPICCCCCYDCNALWNVVAIGHHN